MLSSVQSAAPWGQTQETGGERGRVRASRVPVTSACASV